MAKHKLKNIIQGWSAYFKNEQNELARERAEICKGCEFAEVGTYEKIIKDSIKEVQGLKCAKCGCPLSTKLRSINETCDLKLW